MSSYRPKTLLPKIYPSQEYALDQTQELKINGLNLELEVVKKLANPYSCPVEFLPILAYTFGSDFYWELQNLTESQQREMIANSLYLHRKKGTVWAIKRVLEILGFDINVVEWWQNDTTMEELGIKPQEPYTFAVVLDVAKFYNSSKTLLSESEQRRILKYLYIYKNVRSHFDFYLKTNIKNSISAPSIAELTECKVETLEGEDYQKESTQSISYTSIADIRDTEIRNLESVDSKKVADLNIANFSSAELIECKTEKLEGEDFIQNSNPNSISYVSVADIRDTEIRNLESVDSKKVADLNIANFSSAELIECKTEKLEGEDFIQDSNPNSISYISIADIRDTEIRELESSPIEKSLNSINIKSLMQTRDSAIINFKSNPIEEVKNEMSISMIISMQEVVYG
jgi:phage tail P2-like protein